MLWQDPDGENTTFWERSLLVDFGVMGNHAIVVIWGMKLKQDLTVQTDKEI